MCTCLSLLDAEVIRWTKRFSWKPIGGDLTDEDLCYVEVMIAAARQIISTRPLHPVFHSHVPAIPMWLQECLAFDRDPEGGSAVTLLLLAANMDGAREDLFWTSCAIDLLVSRGRVETAAEHANALLLNAGDRALESLAHRNFNLLRGPLHAALSAPARRRLNTILRGMLGPDV